MGNLIYIEKMIPEVYGKKEMHRKKVWKGTLNDKCFEFAMLVTISHSPVPLSTNSNCNIDVVAKTINHV